MHPKRDRTTGRAAIFTDSLHLSTCISLFFYIFLSVCLYTLLNVSTHTHSDCQGAFERDFKRHVLSPQLQETVFLETFPLKIHSKGWNITDQTMMDRNRRTQIKSVCAHLYVCVIRRQEIHAKLMNEWINDWLLDVKVICVVRLRCLLTCRSHRLRYDHRHPYLTSRTHCPLDTLQTNKSYSILHWYLNSLTVYN